MKRLILTIVAVVAIALQAAAAKIDSMEFRSARDFRIVGKGFTDTESFYDRLPASVKEGCREELWTLSTNSAGMAVRFRSNSKSIAVKWTVRQQMNMGHMTTVGIRGVDLYRLTDEGWRHVCSGRPSTKSKENSGVLIENMDGQFAEYMLYLPLYDGVSDVQIGVDRGAEIGQPFNPSPRADRSVVFYGTSITQGGCANRAGMCYSSILSRDMDFEAFNLGFSGNARCDIYIAEALARLNPTVYFLDFVPNCTAKMIEESAIKFIEVIRKAHPTTPIIMLDSYKFPPSQFNLKQRRQLEEKTVEMKKVAEHFKRDKNFYFYEGESYNDDECSVDGAHLTDLGFKAMADHYKKLLKKHIRK